MVSEVGQNGGTAGSGSLPCLYHFAFSRNVLSGGLAILEPPEDIHLITESNRDSQEPIFERNEVISAQNKWTDF